jgi:hypothetical protein
MTLVCSSLRTLGNFLLIFDCRWWQARKIAIPSSLPISRCFASISVIDVILIWQGLWSPVALDNYIEKPNPLLKTGNMILGDVSGTRAFVELNAATLFQGGNFCDAPCAFFRCPRVDHDGTKINISG